MPRCISHAQAGYTVVCLSVCLSVCVDCYSCCSGINEEFLVVFFWILLLRFRVMPSFAYLAVFSEECIAKLYLILLLSRVALHGQVILSRVALH